MENAELADLFATDVVLMRLVGMNPVVVHGGGPQITDLMRKLGKEPEFVDGRRVTDEETIDIVRMALVGKVNREIVAVDQPPRVVRGRALGRGCRADPRRPARSRASASSATCAPSTRRWCFRLLREELIPVIATVGVDDAGQAYNVNADTVAGAIAEALDAEKLVYLTDVAGVYGDWPDETLAHLSHRRRRPRAAGRERQDLGRHDPQARVVRRRAAHGVRRAHILDGRLPHALLFEFFTREGVGTMVSKPGADRTREEPRRRLARSTAGGRSRMNMSTPRVRRRSASTRCVRSTPSTSCRRTAGCRSSSCAARASLLFDADGNALPRLPVGPRGHVARPRAP